MEIQTFLIAERITQTGNRHDVRSAAIAYMECSPETPFPVEFTMPGLLLLRRESRFGNTPFHLRFDLVDEDGRAVGQPHRLMVEGVFPDGYRFFTLVVPRLAFKFPSPGFYRLDIRVDDEFAEHVYTYNIDIVSRATP